MDTKKKEILIIEDDKAIGELERDYLEAADFAVTIARDGAAGLELAKEKDWSLIVLDLMLPHIDGFSICRAVRREKDVPILMVSARREDADKVRGLGLGADDYMTKPFSPSELVARVRAHIARFERLTGGSGSDAILAGALEIRPAERRVFRDSKEIALANREFELLLFLARHPGIVFSRDALYEKIWGQDAMGDTATVMVHIGRIREKVEPHPDRPEYIETVWGAGYRFRSK